jgi:hypothetical protein
MALLSSDDLYARYATQLPWNRKQNCLRFELTDGATVQEFGANGLGAPEQ